MQRSTVTKAIECALERHSTFNTKARKIIVEMNNIRLIVCSQYDNPLYTKKKNGIITDDAGFVSLANGIVHYIQQPIVGVKREAELSHTFIDGIIFQNRIRNV